MSAVGRSLSQKRLYQRYWTNFFDHTASFQPVHVIKTPTARLVAGLRYLWTQDTQQGAIEVYQVSTRLVHSTIPISDFSTAKTLESLVTGTGTFRGEPFVVLSNGNDANNVFSVHMYSADGRRKLRKFSLPEPVETLYYFHTNAEGFVVCQLNSLVIVCIDIVSSAVHVVRLGGISICAIALQPAAPSTRELTIWAEAFMEIGTMVQFRIQKGTGHLTGPFRTEFRADSLTDTVAMNEHYQARKGVNRKVWVTSNKVKQLLSWSTGGEISSIASLVGHSVLLLKLPRSTKTFVVKRRADGSLEVVARRTATLPQTHQFLGLVGDCLIARSIDPNNVILYAHTPEEVVRDGGLHSASDGLR